MLPRALRNIRDGLLGLAYPASCRLCGRAVDSWDDGVACAPCWDDPAITKILTGSVCAKCGAPVSQSNSHGQPSTRDTNRLCGECSSFPFDAARACGIYSGAIEASVLFLKVHPHICPRLRAIILRTLVDNLEALASDVVMPVPLHRSRERQRGFNQASIIARIISSKFGMRFDDRSLIRVKPTDRHRAGMDAADRAQSVERAFEVTRPRLVEGAALLLVDDVQTTGSTVCAAAECLVKARARRVSVLTIARVGNTRPGSARVSPA